MNQNRDHPAAIAIGATPLTRAECPMILAKGKNHLDRKGYRTSTDHSTDFKVDIALYLQIKGKATYWSTGVVDPETLQPAGIQPPESTSSQPPQSTSQTVAARIVPRVWGQVP